MIYFINSDNFGDYWIGASNLGSSGGIFHWFGSDKKKVGYANWQDGEPSHSWQGQEENCVLLANEWNYKWNDFSCDSSQNYVCEEVTTQNIQLLNTEQIDKNGNNYFISKPVGS